MGGHCLSRKSWWFCSIAGKWLGSSRVYRFALLCFVMHTRKPTHVHIYDINICLSKKQYNIFYKNIKRIEKNKIMGDKTRTKTFLTEFLSWIKLRARNKSSWVKPVWVQLNSIWFGLAWNSAQIQHDLFFQLEFGSFKVHKQFGSAR
jgi:hypothetical protein